MFVFRTDVVSVALFSFEFISVLSCSPFCFTQHIWVSVRSAEIYIPVPAVEAYPSGPPSDPLWTLSLGPS